MTKEAKTQIVIDNYFKSECDVNTSIRKAFEKGFRIGVQKGSVASEPVKHGHWTSSQGLAEVGEVQCSNCKTIYYAEDLYNVGETDENGIGQALMPNYCPHCGAHMGVETK